MSRTTKEINKITGTVISVSGRLIVYALVILLLYEGISRGYSFGYELFHGSGMVEAPGVNMKVTLSGGETVGEIADALVESNLIKGKASFLILSRLYEYRDEEVAEGSYMLNNSMTMKEIILTLRDGPEEEETE